MNWRCRLEFREATLENGLEIVAECNPRAYSTCLAYFVRTGARDETDEISGVSHFLEHMVFKGTPNRTADDINRELDEIGAHSNAFTSEERTVYYACVLPEYQDHATELLSDLMRPSLRENDFDIEKKVILEEIYKYEDSPPFGAHEKCMAAHFGPHPLGRNILGTVKSVDGLTQSAMQAYFDERYSPGNITLVAVGRVDFERLVAKAKQLCGHWETFHAHRQATAAKPQRSFQVITKPSAVQQYVIQIAPGPSGDEHTRYAARVLAVILGDDSGSRFYWDLVETGLAECAAIGTYEFQAAGIFMTFLCCEPDQASDNLRRIHEIIQAVQQDGVTQAELTQAQNKISAQIILASERSSNRLFSVGTTWTQRHEYLTVNESVDAFRSVTLADIAASLQKYPLLDHTTVAVGPLEELADPVN